MTNDSLNDSAIKQIADHIWRKMQPGESGVSRDMIAVYIMESMGEVQNTPDVPSAASPATASPDASLVEKIEDRIKPFEDNADDFDRGTIAGLLEAVALIRAHTAPAQTREIPVVDEERINTLIFNTITRAECGLMPSQRSHLMRVIYHEIKPYLRTTEPVSLKHLCWLYERDIARQIDTGTKEVNRGDAFKTALDAAGVKYVD